MKLISMTDFVLQQDKLMRHQLNDPITFTMKVTDYALFLKKPITLGMFVPCDSDGNVLEEPEPIHTLGIEPADYEYNDNEVIQYKNAKSKVLFNGFYLDETYKREKLQLPYLTNGKISVFLHADFAIRHQIIEDLVSSDLDLAVSF